MSVTYVVRVPGCQQTFLYHKFLNCFLSIQECALADYVSGIQSEKVPFVFLPVQGQLINPNAEIALSGNLISRQQSLGRPAREQNVDLAPRLLVLMLGNVEIIIILTLLLLFFFFFVFLLLLIMTQPKMYGLKVKWSFHLFASSPKPIF